MRSLLFDLRHGLRALVKAPAFTLITILTLALGIGANSAIFSLVNAALVRPLGFADPERLMVVYESIPPSGVERFDVAPADYLDLVQYQRSFSAIGAYRILTVELSGGGQAEQIDAAEITSSLFGTLGVAASEGRTFLPEEDQQQSNVAIISHALWTRRFGGRSPLGSAIVLDRKPYTVVGVMPADSNFRAAAHHRTRPPRMSGFRWSSRRPKNKRAGKCTGTASSAGCATVRRRHKRPPTSRRWPHASGRITLPVSATR